jgi:HEAT repeat protein
LAQDRSSLVYRMAVPVGSYGSRNVWAQRDWLALGTDRVPALRDGLSHPDPLIRRAAATVLNGLSVMRFLDGSPLYCHTEEGRSLLPALLTAIDDVSPEVRRQAAGAMACMLLDPDSEARQRMTGAIRAGLAPRVPSLTAELQTAVESKQWSFQQSRDITGAVRALHLAGGAAREAVPTLLDLWVASGEADVSSSPDAIREAVWAIGPSGTDLERFIGLVGHIGVNSEGWRHSLDRRVRAPAAQPDYLRFAKDSTRFGPWNELDDVTPIPAWSDDDVTTLLRILHGTIAVPAGVRAERELKLRVSLVSQRVLAAMLLGTVRTRVAEAAEALQQTAADRANDRRLRIAAVIALGVLNVPSSAATLLQLLGDTDITIRWRAAVGLGRLRHLAAIPALRQGLADPDMNIVAASAIALGAFGEAPSSAVLERVLEAPSLDNELYDFELYNGVDDLFAAYPPVAIDVLRRSLTKRSDCASALRVARNMGPEAIALVPDIVATLRGGCFQWPDIALSHILRGSDGASAVAKEAIEALYGHETPSGYNRHSEDALVEIGSGIAVLLPRVIAELKEAVAKDWSPSHRSLRLLGAMGPAAAPALPFVVEAWDSTERDAAIRGIGPDALPGIVVGAYGEMVRQRLPEILLLLTGDEYAMFGVEGSRLGQISDASVEALAQLLSDPRARGGAARVLAMLGSRAGPAIASLCRALESDEAAVRLLAVHTLRDIGVTGSPAVSQLAALADGADPLLRAAAIAALGEIGEPSVGVLLERARRGGSDAETRVILLQALGASASASEPVLDALSEGSRDEDPDVRRAAVASIGVLGVTAPGELQIAIRAADDQVAGVRAAAADALGTATLDQALAVGALVRLTADHDVLVQQRALSALARLRPAAPDHVIAVARALQTSESALSRSLAALALREIGPPAIVVLDVLIGWVNDPDPTVRENVVAAIGALGPGAARALPVLEQADKAYTNLGRFVECARRRIQQRFEWHESMAWQSALPEFEWVRPTVRGLLPRATLAGPGATLGSVAETLTAALARQGYSDRSFLAVGQDGFAIVTRAERINETGAALPPPNRWETGPIAPGFFNVREIVRWLQHGDVRHLRVAIVLVAKRFHDGPATARAELSAFSDWISTQGLRLPSILERTPFDTRSLEQYDCAVFVYHFRKLDDGRTELVSPDGYNLAFGDHMRSIGLEPALRELGK